MGYYVDLVEASLDIESTKYEVAIDCFTKLMAPHLFWDWGGSKTARENYSWVNNSRCEEILSSEILTKEEKIIDLFQEWGYVFDRLLLKEGGGIVSRPPDHPPLPKGTPFLTLTEKEYEKWGDDEILWGALAPSIKQNSVIRFKGDEHYDYWQYKFACGTMLKTKGIVTWED